MNLMKLFNFNYFKENIKKSKGLVLFLMLIVPLFNIISLALSLINIGSDSLFNFSDISIITYLAMYIVPIALAFILFGFVFKKKSVDFVLSMPLNRSTIFFTNILGGIILIFIFALLNSLIFGLFNIASVLVIPFKLIFDYFLYWFVAYIFMFLLTSLAISIAGNFMSSIVLILIIICLFPFLNISNILLDNQNSLNTYIKCNDKDCIPDNYKCFENEECQEKLKNNEYLISLTRLPENNYVAPLTFLNDDGLRFNLISLEKMLALSCVYLVLSYVIFLKRKMENNEMSFKYAWLHYLVKCITLLPVCFITYIFIKDDAVTGLVLSVVGIVFYSIIYDLITRKEIYKFFQSTFVSLCAFGLLIGFYSLNTTLFNKNSLDVSDIDYFVYNYHGHDIKVDDKELINSLIKGNGEYKTYTRLSMDMYANNKRYEAYLKTSFENIELLDALSEEELAKKMQQFDIKHFDYVEDIKLDKKLKKLIQETFNNGELKYSEDDVLLKAYDYKNHEYQELYIPSNLNKELDNYVLRLRSLEAIKQIKNAKEVHFYVYDENLETENYVFDYVINKNIISFMDYLQNENNKVTDDTLKIWAYARNEINIPIGNKNDFMEEYKKYRSKLENDEEFQNLIKGV